MSVWKQGDTLPDMTMDCFDANGQRADLSGATTVTVKVSKAGTLLWSREANKPANGTVVLPLLDGDTDTPGTFYVKVFAVWPNGKRQHYPPGDKYMTMTVTR